MICCTAEDPEPDQRFYRPRSEELGLTNSQSLLSSPFIPPDKCFNSLYKSGVQHAHPSSTSGNIRRRVYNMLTFPLILPLVDQWAGAHQQSCDTGTWLSVNSNDAWQSSTHRWAFRRRSSSYWGPIQHVGKLRRRQHLQHRSSWAARAGALILLLLLWCQKTSDNCSDFSEAAERQKDKWELFWLN